MAPKPFGYNAGQGGLAAPAGAGKQHSVLDFPLGAVEHRFQGGKGLFISLDFLDGTGAIFNGKRHCNSLRQAEFG